MEHGIKTIFIHVLNHGLLRVAAMLGFSSSCGRVVEGVIVVPLAVAHVGPFGLKRYADQFLGAALRFEPQDNRFQPVPYYLVCRSLELSLKSYLLARGVPREDPTDRFGHNLKRALRKAQHLGLAAFVELTPDEEALIKRVNGFYEGKQFEYFENLGLAFGHIEPPPLQDLKELAARFVTGLEPATTLAINGPIGSDGRRVT